MATVQAAVRHASSEKVLDAGARLGTVNTAFPFLGAASSILDYQAQDFIVQRLRAGPTPSDKSEFAEYLAMATCCHCLDGWRYLAKAAYSLLNGSRNTALHLAYYAELRAAISVLSGAGIGILDGWHFSIDQNGDVLDFGGLRHGTPNKPIGTHVAAWEALKEWASIQDNANCVLQCIESGGFSAETWADSCKLSNNRSSIARNWLQKWSCDLRQFRTDSLLRNRASYRVNLCADSYAPTNPSDLKLIRDVCDACISQTEGRMDGLDRALIYDLCTKAIPLTLRRPVQPNDPRLWQNMQQWFEGPGGIGPLDAQDIVSTIKDVPSSTTYGILSAAVTGNPDVSGVLCRAILLLRLAMALLEWQWRQIRLRAAGGGSPWQQTLLRRFAENCHLLAPGARPPNWVDLSQDHQKAIDEVDEWLTAGFSTCDLWQVFAVPFRELCRLERIALWVAAP